MTDGASRVVLLAHPAGHSISPAMQNAAFEALGLNVEYRALDVPPDALAAAVERLRDAPYLGANVSVPHKQAVALLVDELTPEARAIGAVNTVVRSGPRLLGHNTDGHGFLRALSELDSVPRPGERCVVLGAGGAARAVVWALAGAGARVGVFARNPERTGKLVGSLARALEQARLDPGLVRALPDAVSALGEARLLVNGTSVGMSGGPDETGLPLLLPADLERLRDDAAVVDLVYRPAETPLLRAAAARGLKRQNGLPMLIWQGALALEAWTGQAAPVRRMRAAAERALADDHG